MDWFVRWQPTMVCFINFRHYSSTWITQSSRWKVWKQSKEAHTGTQSPLQKHLVQGVTYFLVSPGLIDYQRDMSFQKTKSFSLLTEMSDFDASEWSFIDSKSCVGCTHLIFPLNGNDLCNLWQIYFNRIWLIKWRYLSDNLNLIVGLITMD